MPQLFRIPALLQLLNYLQLSLVLLSFLPFAIVVMSIFFVLVIPFFWGYIWACLICKIFSLSTKCVILAVTLATAPKPVRGSKIDENIGVLINDKEDYKLDPWEHRSLPTSEEVENDKEDDKREPRRLHMSDNSWQFLVPQPIKREEQKSFYEILAFWRKKERREIEENNAPNQ